VQQILLNLLSNALKFTPPGGSIHLSCARDGDMAVIRVQDTGRGIATTKLEWIFEPFVQVDRRYKREQEGIGLGLAISRELARAMGGDLLVESEEGAGSAFELRLPLSSAAAP
jgi:signal transduction histidine kinase